MKANLESRIRERAYLIWEGEGRPAGLALAHWLQAEQELRRGKTRSGSAPGDEPAPKRTRATRSKSSKARPSTSPGKTRSRTVRRDH